MDFLPTTREELERRGWYYYDFLVVTGDAYVDHPSFGTAIISRLLESEGYRVAVLAQPRFDSARDFAEMGRPRYAVMISAGNIDSMVAAYTVARKRRKTDYYSPGGRAGLRPDRAVTVYSKLAREAFGELPVVIGGLEASLRRFAHYDYWADEVMPSVLVSSGADILSYGMGEYSMSEIARRLASGEKPDSIRNIRGTCFLAPGDYTPEFDWIECPSFEQTCINRGSEALAVKMQYEEQDPVRGRAVIQRHGDRVLVQNPPSHPISTPDFDRVYELPYMREPHPKYEAMGGVKSIEEVRFSITHNRGCFGFCNFCSLAFHQGRAISVRSHESVIREAKLLTKLPGFKGYIHDVGGPTANFRHPSCAQQREHGLCKNRRCLAPTPCPNLDADQSDYLALLRKLRAIDGVKRVFIRSGIRFDYLMQPGGEEFFEELVRYHVSGQLKVAPEHCSNAVLDLMAKPHFEVYREFEKKYAELNRKFGMKQYLVPYLISSHPGSTLSDAIALAEYLNATGRKPEQVQDFYPTPGTISTAMYHTGIDPRTMKPVYVARSPHEKAMQRALLQWSLPQNRALVLEALRLAHREDLIGYSKHCLLPPPGGRKPAGPGGAPRAQAQTAHGVPHRPASSRETGRSSGGRGPTGNSRNANGGLRGSSKGSTNRNGTRDGRGRRK